MEFEKFNVYYYFFSIFQDGKLEGHDKILMVLCIFFFNEMKIMCDTLQFLCRHLACKMLPKRWKWDPQEYSSRFGN